MPKPQPQSLPASAPVLTKAALRAASTLGLNQRTLAGVLGLSPASVSRMAGGKMALDPDSKSWELALLLVRLFRGLDALAAGDETTLRAWMKNPNSDLHAVPAELIATVAGLVQTVDYVDAYRARL